jgi:hypothetical protein
MRKAIMALVLLSSTPALAQQKGGGDFGLGLQVGAPTGLNAKYYMDRVALQAGLGVIERGWDDGLHIFADVLFHPLVLTTQDAFTMPLYVGVGARILEDDNDNYYWCNRGDCYYYDDYDNDTHVGVRVPVGVLMAFHKVPIDAFLELAPVLDFIHDDDGYCRDGVCYNDDDRLSIYLTLGARWYF